MIKIVDKKLDRILVICPNGHKIVTRKQKDIQCRICALKNKYSRFNIPDIKNKENNVSQTINN